MTTADVVGENILRLCRLIRWGLESSLAISLLLLLLMLSPADYDKVLFKTLSSCGLGATIKPCLRGLMMIMWTTDWLCLEWNGMEHMVAPIGIHSDRLCDDRWINKMIVCAMIVKVNGC